MPGTEKQDSAAERTAPAGPSGLRRRWLLNGALLVLIGVLAWLALHRAGQQQDAAGPPLTALTGDTVSRLRIERPGRPDTVLEKSGQAWALTAPVRARANRFNVDNLLRVAAAPVSTRFAAAGTDLAQYGLDKPQSRLWLDSEEIAFGSLHPLNDRVYVLYRSEVRLIPGHYLGPAAYPYGNFIDSRLFEEDRKLTALKLPDFSLTLNDGSWQRQPADDKLASDRLSDFAAEWQNARALGAEKFSGREILDRIEITTQRDGKTEKLQLGVLAYKPGFVLYRQDENLEYHFTEETGKRLLNLSSGDK